MSYLHTAVAFLSKGVKYQDKDDFNKLLRLITYLKELMNSLITIELYGTECIRWWIVSLFTLHNDIGRHTG